MPRILHIITRMDAGGSATNTRVSVARQRERGFTAELLYGATHDPGNVLRDRLRQSSIPVHVVNQLVRNPSPWRDLIAICKIYRVVRRGRYDLVHTHTSKAGVLGRLACRWLGVPVVHTPHGHVFYGYFNRWVTLFYVLLERWMAHYCRYIVSLTDSETTEALARGIGRPEQYVTVPSGVPLKHFLCPGEDAGREFRACHGIPANAFVFVSVGRLTPIKGYDLLLEAFGKLATGLLVGHPLYLVLVGDGTERVALERQASLGSGARIIFAGEQADVRPALWAADAFVLASRNEGMGRAFVEALAAGLPVIGPDVGGIAHVIQNENNGLLAPDNKPASMAEAMHRMVVDEDLRRRMTANASGSVYPDYDEDTMIEKLVKLYKLAFNNGRLRRKIRVKD